MIPGLNDFADVQNAPVVTTQLGERARDWENAVTVREPCQHQPAGSSETRETSTRDQVVRTETFWFRYGVNITAYSRIIHHGITYDVDGEPQRWTTLGGVPHHAEVQAIASQG